MGHMRSNYYCYYFTVEVYYGKDMGVWGYGKD